MTIVIPITIISFFLESICSNFISMNHSLFLPLFSIVSLVIIYPYFNNNDVSYLKYCILIGLCYDLIFTNTFILNAVLFLIIGLIIKLINFVISNNIVNIILIIIISIVLYLTLSYFILVIVGYLPLNFNYLIKKIYSSIILNIIYGIITYLICNYFSYKYKIIKID